MFYAQMDDDALCIDRDAEFALANDPDFGTGTVLIDLQDLTPDEYEDFIVGVMESC